MTNPQFEHAVRQHFSNPPETWAVHKVAPRRWTVADRSGNRIETKDTRKAAEDAREHGTYVAIWYERTAWYFGTSTNCRDRPLTDTERVIVAQVRAELALPAVPTTPGAV